MSDPASSDENPAASAAALPPEDPPGVLFKSHGFPVTPVSYTHLRAHET